MTWVDVGAAGRGGSFVLRVLDVQEAKLRPEEMVVAVALRSLGRCVLEAG